MTLHEFALRFARQRYRDCTHAHVNPFWCVQHASYWPSGEVCHLMLGHIGDMEEVLEAWVAEPEHVSVAQWPYRPTQPKEST